MSDYFAFQASVGAATLLVDTATMDRVVHLELGTTYEASIGFTSAACVFALGQHPEMYFSFVLPAGEQLYGKSGPGDTSTISGIVTKSPSSLSLGFCS